MIKDTRYIIKRVIIGVLICLILSFIRTCEVKAETSLQTVSLNYNQEIPATAGTDFNIFQSSNTLKNYGRGVLQFNLVTYSFSVNTSHLNNSIREVIVSSNNNIFTCNIGNAINNYDEETNYDVNLYTVLCDVNLGSNGLQSIDVKMVYNLSNKYTLRSSQFMTFKGDVDFSILNNLDTINNTLVTYLQSVYNASIQTATNTGATNNYLSAIQIMLNSDLSQIITLMSNNTQAIIDNQNQNTQEQIESQQVCDTIDKNDVVDNGKFLNSIGNVTNSNNFGITDYIKITKKTKITTITNVSSNTSIYFCYYNVNKTLISCTNSNTTIGEDLVIPNNANFVRFSIYVSNNRPSYKICKSGNQANNDAINNVNDTLNDSSVDNPNGSLTDMNSKIATNSVISDLLLLPVTLFQNIVNSINGTCSTFNLGSLFGTNLTMPCIDIESIIGSALWGVIDILLCGLFVLAMRKKFVDIFQNITSLKDGGNQVE